LAAMINIYDNTHNWFPHLAPVINVINNNGRIFVAEHNAVIVCYKNNTLIPGCHFFKGLGPASANMFFDVGCLNMFELIEDKKKRFEAVESFGYNKGFFKAVTLSFKLNRVYAHGYARNILAPWTGLSFSQKIRYLLALLAVDIFFILKYPYYSKKRKEYREKKAKSYEDK
jgi:hypothetical protein